MPRRGHIDLSAIRIVEPEPPAPPAGAHSDDPKPECAVTFRNDGAVDIIVEPRNDFGNFDKAVLVPSGRSTTTQLYGASYIVTLYSMGYEKEFFPSFQRWGVHATSADITVGFDDDNKKFSWKVNAILRGGSPLFPQEEMDSNNATRDDEDSITPVEFDETDLSDKASDVDSSEGLDPRYKSLDIVFILDATANHGAFLSSTISAIKSALRENETSQAFRMRSFRAALVVTRDYAEDGSGLERLAFTSSLNRFEAELDAVEVGGGGNGFCAFNTGMGDALGPDMGWRIGVRRLIIVATAGIPHAIGEKQDEDEVEGYTISLSDPIRMTRRISLLGIDLAFLTDADLVSSNNSRVLCFYCALSRMVSGAGVYQTGDPDVIWNHIAPAMPSGWSDRNVTRVRELKVSEEIQRSSAFQQLDRIYSGANTLTCSSVRDALGIDTPYAIPMAGRMAFARVTFVNNGRTKIGVQCRDNNRRTLLNKSLGSRSSASASVQANSKFSYVLSTTRKKKELTDRTSSNKSIDVSRKI